METLTAAAASARTLSTYQTVVSQLDRLADILARTDGVLERTTPRVSKWSVRQHVEHLVVTGKAIVGAVDGALGNPPPDPEKRPVLLGKLVLWLRFIPRGVGEAPPETSPRDTDLEAVRTTFANARNAIADMGSRLVVLEQSVGRTLHPAMGYLNAKQWLEVMAIHQRHHLKIIADIQNAHSD